MKPLPAQGSVAKKAADEAIPSLPSPLPTTSGPYSKANRRSSSCPIHRAYPWLLAGSTAIAAIFCLMYITKPVVVSSTRSDSENPGKSILSNATASTFSGNLMPSSDQLPGESGTPLQTKHQSTANRTLPAPPSASAFEETNLRVQHVLTAETPAGHLARIDLDVPVIYRSRNLQWTPDQVAEARNLMLRLMDYQDKSRQLRSEGAELLKSWNQLIAGSIPAPDLRADSPSLPANQEDSSDAPRPASLITTESIQIQPVGK